MVAGAAFLRSLPLAKGFYPPPHTHTSPCLLAFHSNINASWKHYSLPSLGHTLILSRRRQLRRREVAMRRPRQRVQQPQGDNDPWQQQQLLQQRPTLPSSCSFLLVLLLVSALLSMALPIAARPPTFVAEAAAKTAGRRKSCGFLPVVPLAGLSGGESCACTGRATQNIYLSALMFPSSSPSFLSFSYVTFARLA